MSPLQYGLQSYHFQNYQLQSQRRHAGIGSPNSQPSHPLDILSDILFDIKSENRRGESNSHVRPRPLPQERDENPDDFQKILKRELEK